MTTAGQYQKLGSQPSQDEISTDPIVNDDSALTDSQKTTYETQEIIVGQVVSMPSTMVSANPRAMTGHNSAASHQYPTHPGVPHGGHYELANFQTYKQGQPSAFIANPYDPEIGLNNHTDNGSSPLLSYHEIYLAGRPGCWRAFAGLLALGCGVTILGALAVSTVFAFLYGFMESTFEIQLDPLTPDTLIFANLVLGCSIPVAWFLTRELHGVHHGWLASVEKQIRWRWLLTCLGLSALVLIVTLLISTALEVFASMSIDGTDDADDEFKINEWDDTTMSFLLVILLTTPLQAAAEEYAFRGYLTQAFGGLGSKWVALLIPSFLFALAHGSQTAPIFLDRLAFGVVSALLVVKTGGLEAGIAMHILNNFVAFIWALLFGNITASMQPQTENWWKILIPIVQLLGYYFLAVKVARKKNIQTSVSKMIVEGQRY